MNKFYKNREIIDNIINSGRLNIQNIELQLLKDLILKISFYKEIIIPSYYYSKIFNEDLKRQELNELFQFLINSINSINSTRDINTDTIDIINYNDYIF